MFCVHGRQETHSCQVGTAWDNRLRVCNFPDLVDCDTSVDVITVPDPGELLEEDGKPGG